MNVLILDSGHGYNTPGKRNEKENFLEYEFNNSMQYLIKEMLMDFDIKVLLTNPYPKTTKDIPLIDRVAYANKNFNKVNNTMFLSLHANAYNDSSVRGIETYTAKQCSNMSTIFAKCLHKEVLATCQALDSSYVDRKVKTSDFYVIKNTNCPAVLIEYGFYTNLSDLRILKNKQTELARATVRAILKYFNIESDVKGNIVENTTSLYKVYVGTFKEYDNAKTLVNDLKLKGISSYIEVIK